MMMLRTGDVNPNSFVQRDSGMERLKQAMLQHELIFRNQVQELHRLYWTQKNLMNELHRKGFNAHAPSSSSRVAMTKCKGSAEEKNEFPESSCTRENMTPLEEFMGRPTEIFRNHVINFSLHLPADEFIRDTGENLSYSHPETEVSKSNGIVDVTQRGNLDCRFEEVIVEKDMSLSAKSFSCREGIDLEASVELECHEEATKVFSGFRAPIQKGTGMLGSQPTALSVQVSSSTVGNETHHIPSMVHLNEGHGGRLLDQKPSISFVRLGDSCVLTIVDQSGIKQQAKPVLIDLNLPREDECSHDLNDPEEDINLKFGSSVVHNGILEHEQSNLVEASFARKPVPSSSVAKTSCENRADWFSCHDQYSKPFGSLESKLAFNTTKDKGDTENMVGAKVMASSCQVQVECCGNPVEGSIGSNDEAFITVNAVPFSSVNLFKEGKRDVDFPSGKLPSAAHSDNKRQDSNITSSNSTNLPQTVIKKSVNKLGSHEGSEEDTLSSHTITQDEAQCHAPSRKFPTIENVCCSSQDKIAKEAVALSNTDDSVTTQLYSSQNEGSSMAKLMPVEGDLTIAAAAEALIGISSEESVIPIVHQPDGIQLLEVDCDYMNNQPLHSSDSFECMVLQLSEVQSKDHLNISKSPSMIEAGKNMNGLSLRKGRGLRDFQKEILPGLASLARHEICDDLHNIGHKLRRTASRNARENWFVPVRGRRSRLYSGCRRS